MCLVLIISIQETIRMAKVTLKTLASNYSSVSQLNDNFTALATALENTLSRDGTSPNAMSADFDMNSNRLINLPAPVSDTEPLRKGDIDAATVSAVAAIAADITAVAGITADVTAVAGIVADVTTVATNTASVSTVASSIANVNTVATDIADVSTVAADIADVSTVAANIAEVIYAATGIPKNNFIATTAPLVSDDDVAGYAVGSRWVDTNTDTHYVCMDSTTGTAVWEQTDNTIPTLDTSDILYDPSLQIGSPVHVDTLQEVLDHMWSAGIVDGGALTDNGDGTVAITSGTLAIRASATAHSPLYMATFPANASLALTDNATNYIYVDYNTGSPVLAVTLDPTIINVADKVPTHVVVREGTSILPIATIDEGVDHIAKSRKRDFYTSKFVRVNGGSVISETGTRNLGCTAGSFYFGTSAVSHDAIDTSITGTFEAYRLIAGAWVETDETQFDNLQYNDISTPGAEVLATLDNNKYAVHYVYANLNDSSTQFAVVYSQTQYANLAEAEASSPPSSLPASVEGVGQLLGRFIVQKSATNGLMQSSFTTVFSATQATTHNGLAGLQGGTVDQYYHLTADEHTQATIKQNLVATAAPTATDDSAAGYSVGSKWIDVTNDNVYECVDATATAAVWKQLDGGATTATTAVEGTVEIATTAEIAAETATGGTGASLVMTPADAKHHQGIAKAWVNFNGSGTVAINDSYNVSSITDNGTGDYTINLSITMANANYTTAFMGKIDSGGGSAYSVAGIERIASAQTTTSFRVNTAAGSSFVGADYESVQFTVFGDI